jgi:hypothetical protein
MPLLRILPTLVLPMLVLPMLVLPMLPRQLMRTRRRTAAARRPADRTARAACLVALREVLHLRDRR